jgi:hypothetical protein
MGSHCSWTGCGIQHTPHTVTPSPHCVNSNEITPQVHADFEYIGQAANLGTVCLYGGTDYQPQNNILRRVRS